MRRFGVMLALSPLLMAMSTSAPNLQIFEERPFAAGLWRLAPLDEETRAHMPRGRAMCIANPNAMLYTGFDQAGGNCGHTVLDDGPDHATITYVCKGKGYGRASVRRTGSNRFLVEAQGFVNQEPFDMRGEYQRVADCAQHS